MRIYKLLKAPTLQLLFFHGGLQILLNRAKTAFLYTYTNYQVLCDSNLLLHDLDKPKSYTGGWESANILFGAACINNNNQVGFLITFQYFNK